MNQFFGDYSFLWRKIKFKYRISFWTKEWPSSVKSFYVCIDFKNDQWSHRANEMAIILTIVRGDLTKSIQILINGTHSIRMFYKSWYDKPLRSNRKIYDMTHMICVMWLKGTSECIIMECGIRTETMIILSKQIWPYLNFKKSPKLKTLSFLNPLYNFCHICDTQTLSQTENLPKNFEKFRFSQNFASLLCLNLLKYIRDIISDNLKMIFRYLYFTILHPVVYDFRFRMMPSNILIDLL